MTGGRPLRVVIAAGGTAGHVNPALALAQALGDEQVTFIGTATGVEGRLVPEAGFAMEVIDVRGFDRARPQSLPRVGLTAARAVTASRRILAHASPDVVVGMGGYVALPVCVAARSKGIPVVVHEQNIVLGLTNRICKSFARAVAVSFEATVASAGRRAVNVGNPVLEDLATFDYERERKQGLASFELDPARKTLLVFGGSQGARRINDLVAGLVELWSEKRDRQVLHVSGPAHAHTLQSSTRDHGRLLYRGLAYVERMPEAYAVADIAVCRGGATTVAELGAVGLPAVIVPYPYHRDRQQERHGRELERAGAALVIRDEDATAERVAGAIDPLFEDESRLDAMKRAARAFGRPDAAQRLAQVVREAAA